MAGYAYRRRRRYRYRRYRRASSRDKAVGFALGLAIAVSATAGTATAVAPHGGAGVHGAVPSGSAYTPASWARALLAAGGWPESACNLSAVTAWERAEGGHWANAARFNPLDTTQPEQGSWPMNSVGVQAYPSWAAGFRATLTTLANGRYAAVLAALSAGTSAQAVADAAAASPWGTGPFTASCA